MKKLTEKGFAVAGLIIVIIVIAVIVAAGWFLYDRQQNNKHAEEAASVAELSDGTHGSAVAGYLAIPELGIQLQLADGVKDATYAIMDDGTTVGLSTQTLVDQFGEGCAPQTGEVAQVAVFVDSSGPNAGTGVEVPAVYKNAFRSADGVYYAINYGAIELQPCGNASSDPQSAVSLQKQVTDGFSNTKVEQLR